jgi:hypothetical protein
MQNDTAYGEMLTWKTSGPSDQFKALMDLQAVHPTCRLCQHVASRKRAQEEEAKRKTEAFPPCHCQVRSNLYGVFFAFIPLCSGLFARLAIRKCIRISCKQFCLIGRHLSEAHARKIA